jgi:hypothetical protein
VNWRVSDRVYSIPLTGCGGLLGLVDLIVRPVPARSEPVVGIHAGDGGGTWFHDDRTAIADGSVIVSATVLKPPPVKFLAVRGSRSSSDAAPRSFTSYSGPGHLTSMRWLSPEISFELSTDPHIGLDRSARHAIHLSTLSDHGPSRHTHLQPSCSGGAGC